MVDGNVFCRRTIRLFLYPAALGPDYFDVSCVIHAGPGTDITNVLHEIACRDWFNNVPLFFIPYHDISYGILITPGNEALWTLFHSGIKYSTTLLEHNIEVDSPSFHLPLKEVPRYLAFDCDHSMEDYELRSDMDVWFVSRRGVVVGRRVVQ
jgi:hypothetical protein